MTLKEYKKIEKGLNLINKEIEKQAMVEGIDLLSPEYEMILERAQQEFFTNKGYSLEEFSSIKSKLEQGQEETLKEVLRVSEKSDEVLGKLASLHLMTTSEVNEIAEKVAKENIKPPQITNQIIREVEIIKEKPQVIKQTVVEKTVQEIFYNEKPLQEKMSQLSKRLDELNIPKEFNQDNFRRDLRAEFTEALEKNINVMDMPNFRKLAMGLREQLDYLSGASLTMLPATGTVNGTNTSFTFSSVPKVLVVDNIPLQKTSSNGAVNWTGTNDITLTIAPTFDLYAF